jgi:inositol transport system substrate-binding protein
MSASAAIVVGCSSSSATPSPSAAAPSVAASVAASVAPGAAATMPAVTLSKDITIGVAFPQLDTFLGKLNDGLAAEAAKLSTSLGHKITLNVQQAFVNGAEDPAKQLSEVEDFVAQKVDAIIVIPVDTSAAQPMSDAATKGNIPLVYVNRNPKIAANPYIGSDSLFAGTVEMQQLAKDAAATIATTNTAAYKGNVVILQGQVNNEAAVFRTQGCNDVVKATPGLQVTKTQAGDWMRDKGLSIMENWLQSGDQIDIVCANNDEMAIGAINAIAAANKTGKILVGGVDATADAMAAMQKGTLDTTVFQNAKGQGSGGVDAALVLIAGGKVPSYVDVPYELVNKANMAQYLNK